MESLDQNKCGDAAVIIAETKRGYKPEVVRVERGTSEAASLLVLRDTLGGLKVVSVKEQLDQYLEAPERRKGTAQHTTLESFIAHVQRFADADSALFVNDSSTNPVLTCIFDYHRQTAAGAPRFGEHRATYAFPVSDEWKLWTAPRGWLEQADFAQFLEDRVIDVVDPNSVGEVTKNLLEQLGIARTVGSAKLQGLARGLTVKAEHSVANHVTLDTGEGKILYEEKHADEHGNELTVPNGFVVAIPVFRHGDLYRIPVRLRYRVKGAVRWTFSPCRVTESFHDALGEACAKAASETSLPLFYGSPEA